MTYPDSPHYFSLEDDAQPTVNTVKLTEDETGRVFAIAESWAERCQALGVEPPPDPLRALIAAAEHLFGAMVVMEAIHETGHPRSRRGGGAMMGQWWARHVAWRLMPTPAPLKAARIPTPAKADAPNVDAGCVRCSKPREDNNFKHCRRCRMMASLNQTRRRLALNRKGACPKCGRARDDDRAVCSGCRARERARYYKRKVDGRQ